MPSCLRICVVMVWTVCGNVLYSELRGCHTIRGVGAMNSMLSLRIQPILIKPLGQNNYHAFLITRAMVITHERVVIGIDR